MNPWNLIGWVIIVFALVLVAAWVLGVAATWLAQHTMHTRTRDDAPKPGDIWVRSGFFIDPHELRIKEITDEGRVVIESSLSGLGSRCTWSDSSREWQRRVQVCKLWRSKP